MQEPKIYLKIIVNLLLTVTGIVLLIVFLPKLIRFFLPFVIGGILSVIANPLVKFLERRIKLLRKHSSAIIIVTVLLAVAGVLYLVIWLIVREIGSLFDNLDVLEAQVQSIVDTLSTRLSGIYQMLPESIQQGIQALNVNMGEYLANLFENINLPTISDAGGYVRSIAEVLLMAIFTILSAYFFIAQRDLIAAGANRVLPEGIRKSYQLIVDNFKSAVGGYFKAQFKIMLILMLIMFIGFELLRVDYSFLLALGIAFLDFLPVFGTGAILWPWAIIDVIMGNYVRAIFLVVIYLLCQLIKQLLQPKMVGDSIGISPLQTLIFMFVGYRIKGILGLIIGIPVGMVLINFYRIGMFDRIIKGFKIIATDINEFRKY